MLNAFPKFFLVSKSVDPLPFSKTDSNSHIDSSQKQ